MTEEIRARLDAMFLSCRNSGPASEAVISSAEDELALLFPPSYRLFLARFGASLGDGFELYGLPPPSDPETPPEWPNVVQSTILLRPDSLPENSIEISHDGMDHGYFLQCSRSDPKFEGPVIEWGPDHDGGKIVADSFLEFVEGHLCP